MSPAALPTRAVGQLIQHLADQEIMPRYLHAIVVI